MSKLLLRIIFFQINQKDLYNKYHYLQVPIHTLTNLSLKQTRSILKKRMSLFTHVHDGHSN